MIFNNVQLRNFGVYAGDHRIDLAPASSKSKRRPVVLVGGLNGCGKTTLLDATLLALYGPRARCSKRGALAYEKFLLKSIHSNAATAEGAMVSVEFKYVFDAEPSVYEVRRSWRQIDGGRVQETLQVFHNGRDSTALAERWNELVEEIIPLGLSQLFFFDAEKIRALAEGADAEGIVGSAIRSLMGIDLVERLIRDVQVVARRQKKEQLNDEDRARFEETKTTHDALIVQIGLLRANLASEQNVHDRAQKELDELEEQFTASGGSLTQKREELKARQSLLRSQLETVRHALRDKASMHLPFLLVREQLQAAQAEHGRQVQAAENAVLLRELESRDAHVVEHCKLLKASEKLTRSLAQMLEEDRLQRTGGVRADPLLLLAQPAGRKLDYLLSGLLDDELSQTRKLLREHTNLVRELADVDRSLTFAPKDEEHVERILSDIREANVTLAKSAELIHRMERDLREKKAQEEQLQQKLIRLLEQNAVAQAREQDASRIIELAERSALTMEEFLDRIVRQKIELFARSVTEAFKHLMRKTDFVTRIEIDPKTFGITMLGSDGKRVPRDVLSEGEKQLFAIAILWGLAKASPKPLPAIIDTPMARLDSKHRQHIVERYFPNASHQVILLSTDTEVEGSYHDLLKPYLSKSYVLEYDQKAGATSIREGYFEPELEHVG